jgi:GTP cyclohydrolase FolE2
MGVGVGRGVGVGVGIDIDRVSALIAGIDVVSSSCCPCAKLQLKRAIKNDIDTTAA